MNLEEYRTEALRLWRDDLDFVSRITKLKMLLDSQRWDRPDVMGQTISLIASIDNEVRKAVDHAQNA